MNQNQLARIVTLLEGHKKNLNIADVKEVLKCESLVVKELPVVERLKLIIRRFF